MAKRVPTWGFFCASGGLASRAIILPVSCGYESVNVVSLYPTTGVTLIMEKNWGLFGWQITTIPDRLASTLALSSHDIFLAANA